MRVVGTEVPGLGTSMRAMSPEVPVWRISMQKARTEVRSTGSSMRVVGIRVPAVRNPVRSFRKRGEIAPPAVPASRLYSLATRLSRITPRAFERHRPGGLPRSGNCLWYHV